MHTTKRILWAFAVLASAWASVPVAAQTTTTRTAAPPTTTTTTTATTTPGRSSAPQVIGTHQINRFEAIRQLQETVKQNPKSLADWVMLGELAHEVAIDLPADQSGQYYKLSRDAYENALELAPDNTGLRAAVQFARDQEQGLDRFEKSRTAATQMYLTARRRDLAASQFTPTLRVFGPTASPAGMAGAANVGTGTGRATSADIGTPAPRTANTSIDNTAATASSAKNDPAIRKSPTGGDVAVFPAETATSSSSGQSSANYGVRQFYSYPTYQTYAPAQGAPLTYQQFTNSYAPMGTDAGQPVTLQHYYSQQGLPIPGDPTGRPAVPGATTTTPAGTVITPGGSTITAPGGTTTVTPGGTTTTPGGSTTTPPR